MAASPPSSERRFLDPAVLARLGSLELKARTIVEGFLSGLHRSPFKGFSVEFAEYRQYMPGDDLATIDWKVYARSDRHYVKKFEEETNLGCHIMLDVSASMGYGSRGMTKLEYGSCLAASLAYLMNRQRDAVGLTAFDEGIVTMLPASARPGHLRAVLVTLDRLELGRQTNVSKPLHQLAESLSKRGMVVLISDGVSFDLRGGVEQTLAEDLVADRITVFYIHTAEGEPQEETFTLASQTGGQAFSAGDPAALTEVFQRIDAMNPTRLKPVAPEPADWFWPFAVAGLAVLGLQVVSSLGLRFTPW